MWLLEKPRLITVSGENEKAVAPPTTALGHAYASDLAPGSLGPARSRRGGRHAEGDNEAAAPHRVEAWHPDGAAQVLAGDKVGGCSGGMSRSHASAN